MAEVHVYSDLAELSSAAAALCQESAQEAVRARGRFSIALSGGSTPRGLFERLAQEPYLSSWLSSFPWGQTHVFWTDERCVPPEDPASNYGTAEELLLRRVPIPRGQIHRMRGELPPEQAAGEYNLILREYFGASIPLPRFDLILLGMGQNGNCASLYPASPALEETQLWTVANYVRTLGTYRLTLTLPVINNAVRVAFLVAGASKARALRGVLGGDRRFPAARVNPEEGRLEWLVDSAAGSRLRDLAGGPG